MRHFRRLLYRLASLLGDLDAIRNGPRAMARRWLRKAVWRQTGKTYRRWLP